MVSLNRSFIESYYADIFWDLFLRFLERFQLRCSVLKIQTGLVERIDCMVWAHLMTGCIFICKDSHLHVHLSQKFCQWYLKGAE